MDAGTMRRELPARLEGVRRRFERWRETREGHASIPDSLWAAAARAAERYGLSKTANALRVNYHALQKHLAGKATADGCAAGNRIGRRTAAAGDGPETDGTSRFVELPAFASAGPCECCVEWEDGSGAKMRIRLQGAVTPDLLPGYSAPATPAEPVVNPPTVTLGGAALAITFAGAEPGQVGIYRIDAKVPGKVPTGWTVPLVIQELGFSASLPVRVVSGK